MPTIKKKTNTGKLPGKTTYSGRRRISYRTSGYKSHPDCTGGELKIEEVDNFILEKNNSIILTFRVKNIKKDSFVAFGGWFNAPNTVDISIVGGPQKRTLDLPDSPNWSKFGSLFLSDSNNDLDVVVTFTAKEKSELSLYDLSCGIVEHKYLSWAKNNKPVLLKNMYEFSPESNFIAKKGTIEIKGEDKKGGKKVINLKSCNRCARFLPINIHNERHHLSFSNHCVASHRTPCSHSGFGKLTNVDSKEKINLYHGYQLECRFCKKFEVNAAHNPQRTASQMKEDGARRRSFELLLTELHKYSPQMEFRHKNNKELTKYIWGKFNKKCFSCDAKIESANSMHLDHTRPLALLWPLDETATCLCSSCNSKKRDRPPSEFYSETQLKRLSKITGISLNDLKDPTPNLEAISLLETRLDWFFTEFITKPELLKVRDGKVTAELLIKALKKVLEKCPDGPPFNITHLYKQRQ